MKLSNRRFALYLAAGFATLALVVYEIVIHLR